MFWFSLVSRSRVSLLSCCCCLSLSMIVIDRLGCSHLSIVLTLSCWCLRFLCKFVVVVNDEFGVVDEDDVVATRSGGDDDGCCCRQR